MKKNKMMRLASALLVLVILTTCAISGTYAKYITRGDAATDSARVAKWGVTITPTSDSAFKSSYAKDSDTSIDNTVVSSVKVVAPGTNGTLTDVVISGTPEVAVRVTYTADLALSGWTVDSAEYCPIEIKVENATYKIGTGEAPEGVTYVADIAALEKAVEDAIIACKKDYPANTAINTSTDAPSISWAWSFEGNDDAKDTKLGDAGSATITLTVTATATQID